MKVGLNEYLPEKVTDAMIVSALDELRKQFFLVGTIPRHSLRDIFAVLRWREEHNVGTDWP
jgi:hypothetical protein